MAVVATIRTSTHYAAHTKDLKLLPVCNKIWSLRSPVASAREPPKFQAIGSLVTIATTYATRCLTLGPRYSTSDLA